MSAEIFYFDPRPPCIVRVELSSPGTQHVLPFYVVDLVEANGGRSLMWCGRDLMEARRALAECATDGVPLHDCIAALEPERP